VNSKFPHFFVVQNVVQDNESNLFMWYDVQDVFEVVFEAASSCIRNTKSLLLLCLLSRDYDLEYVCVCVCVIFIHGNCYIYSKGR
jgi:hypothetical protein